MWWYFIALPLLWGTIGCSSVPSQQSAQQLPLFPQLHKGDTLVYRVNLHLTTEMEGAMGQQSMEMDIGYRVHIGVAERYRPDSLLLTVAFSDFQVPAEMRSLLGSDTAVVVQAQYVLTPSGVTLKDSVTGANPILAQMFRTGSILQQQLIPKFPPNLLAKGEVRKKAPAFLFNADSVEGTVVWKVLKRTDSNVVIQHTAQNVQISGKQSQHGMEFTMAGTISAEHTVTVKLPEAIVQQVQGESAADMDISMEGQMQMASTVYTESKVKVQLQRYHKGP